MKKPDPALWQSWSAIRSLTLTIQTSSAKREDPNSNCRCCEERLLFHTSGSNPTKDANGRPISAIVPHMVEDADGLHVSIIDSEGKHWKMYKWKDMSNVEFDTKGGANG